MPKQTPHKPGLVWYKGLKRPFFKVHEITEGRDKGKLILLLGGINKVIDKRDILRWPNENSISKKLP